MMFGMGFGALFFWLFVVGLIGWGVNQVFVANRVRNNERFRVKHDAALEILKKRYARGEIDREQFEEMKRNMIND